MKFVIGNLDGSIDGVNSNTRNAKATRVTRNGNQGQNRRNTENNGSNCRRQSRTQAPNGNASSISAENLNVTWCYSFWENGRNKSDMIYDRLINGEIEFSELADNGYEVMYHYGVGKNTTLMKKDSADYKAAEEIVANKYN